jgi:hypothetical protein
LASVFYLRTHGNSNVVSKVSSHTVFVEVTYGQCFANASPTVRVGFCLTISFRLAPRQKLRLVPGSQVQFADRCDLIGGASRSGAGVQAQI